MKCEIGGQPNVTTIFDLPHRCIYQKMKWEKKNYTEQRKVSSQH